MKSLVLGLCLSSTLLLSQSGLGADITLPAGTAFSVKLADTIDSARDPVGKQYAASVAAPVEIAGGPTIPAGSPATIVLVHNNSGWLTQLKSLTVNGRKFDVSSGAGSLVRPEQGNKSSTTGGILAQMGFAADSPVTSPQRLQLPPATALRFVLIGTAGAARPVAVAPRPRSSARSGSSAAVPLAVSQQESQSESGIGYLCSARDRSDRVSPTSYYIAEVFQTSDKPAIVEKRWYQFLVTKYPYRFANNPHATVLCTRLEDSAAGLDARRRLEGTLKSENADIVETRWHYTLGPPPAPATPPPASAAPVR
jgi:hypothetical protein